MRVKAGDHPGLDQPQASVSRGVRGDSAVNNTMLDRLDPDLGGSAFLNQISSASNASTWAS